MPTLFVGESLKAAEPVNYSENATLPKFREPPVGEVSVGIRFNAPGFLPIHFGLFYEKIRGDFPEVKVLPYLPPEPALQLVQGPVPPNFDAAMLASIMENAGGQTRLLFQSPDRTMLVQLQNDRLYFNWRSESSEYPHYSTVREGFLKAYSAFSDFTAEQHIGPVQATLCEVLYVNSLPTREASADLASPEKIFKVWNAAPTEDPQDPITDLAFNIRYQIKAPDSTTCGWLVATMVSGITATNVAKFNLQMIARGLPQGEGLTGILAFHDIAHDAIVRNFAALTTSEMHDLWQRYYD